MGEENLLDLGGDDHGVQLIGQGGHLVQGRAWGRQGLHLSTVRKNDLKKKKIWEGSREQKHGSRE